jgi:hypothetical protein
LHKLSMAAYLGMGWLIVIAIVPLVERMAPAGLAWLVAGGLAYTGGVLFYALDRYPYCHFVWHLFVLTGTACHFVAVMRYADRLTRTCRAAGPARRLRQFLSVSLLMAAARPRPKLETSAHPWTGRSAVRMPETNSAREGLASFRGFRTRFRVVGRGGSRWPLLCIHGGPGFGMAYLQPLEEMHTTGRRGRVL